jgi:hypothetical protein
MTNGTTGLVGSSGFGRFDSDDELQNVYGFMVFAV